MDWPADQLGSYGAVEAFMKWWVSRNGPAEPLGVYQSVWSTTREPLGHVHMYRLPVGADGVQRFLSVRWGKPMAHQYLEYMPKSTFHPKTLIPDMFAMWKPVSDMQQFAWEAEHGGSVRNPRRRRARRNPIDAYPGLLSHAEVVSHFAARKGIPETYIPLGIHQRWRTGTYCHAFLVKEKGHVLVLSTGLPVRLFLPDFKRYFEVLPELEQLALAAVERPRARRNPKDWWPASLDTNAGADAQARAWARKLKVDVSRLGYATSSMGPKAHFLHVYAVGDGYTVLAVESAPDSKGGRHWILTHWTKDTLLSRYLKVPELQALAFASHA